MANDLYFSHIWQKSNLGQFGCRVLESGDSTPAGEYFHTIRPLKNSSFTADNNTTGGDSSITITNAEAACDVVGHFDNISCSHGKIICYLI